MFGVIILRNCIYYAAKAKAERANKYKRKASDLQNEKRSRCEKNKEVKPEKQPNKKEEEKGSSNESFMPPTPSYVVSGLNEKVDKGDVASEPIENEREYWARKKAKFHEKSGKKRSRWDDRW